MMVRAWAALAAALVLGGSGRSRAPLGSAEAAARGGALYPRDSETREVRPLAGVWNFRLAEDPEDGYKNFWFKKDLSKTGPVIPMPVPSSYNDITQDIHVRDHVGVVWYDRRFFVPESWRQNSTRTWLRFGSVHYTAQVWVNGNLVLHHEIGHLPFEKEISKYINFGVENRITVACDNTLLNDSVPQGAIQELRTDGGKRLKQIIKFDFFNYAGIHRPVYIYTTPSIYIDDVAVNTSIERRTGFIFYNVTYGGDPEGNEIFCYINILDRNETVIAHSIGLNGSIELPNANFWWPYLMHPDPGYLYTMEVHLATESVRVLDVYRLKVGIRTVTWSNTSFFINGKPIYMRGVAKHEDSDIRGKGLDLPLVAKDYNLMRWMGSNTFRTSHYPYAEEFYDFADEQGFMIIDECPSVNTEMFSESLLNNHKESLTELIRRDKNHPSVIMWSIANEPSSDDYRADEYFRNVSQHVKSLDPSRAITLAISQKPSTDKAGKHLDVISFNRYNGWYSNTGQLDMITRNVVEEATGWHKKYNKPVLMSEYGADTISGLHLNPEFVWSEEFQVKMMSQTFKAFDALREAGFFVGEFIWNFADFKTDQSITRVGGNRKGIFTRQRQPKAAAHHLRARYHHLAKEVDGAPLPDDLFPYISANYASDRSDL